VPGFCLMFWLYKEGAYCFWRSERPWKQRRCIFVTKTKGERREKARKQGKVVGEMESNRQQWAPSLVELKTMGCMWNVKAFICSATPHVHQVSWRWECIMFHAVSQSSWSKNIFNLIDKIWKWFYNNSFNMKVFKTLY
jgi:hypothetical protein